MLDYTEVYKMKDVVSPLFTPETAHEDMAALCLNTKTAKVRFSSVSDKLTREDLTWPVPNLLSGEKLVKIIEDKELRTILESLYLKIINPTSDGEKTFAVFKEEYDELNKQLISKLKKIIPDLAVCTVVMPISKVKKFEKALIQFQINENKPDNSLMDIFFADEEALKMSIITEHGLLICPCSSNETH